MKRSPHRRPAEYVALAGLFATALLGGCAAEATPEPPPIVTIAPAAARAAELDALRAMSAFRAELLRATIDRRPPALTASRRDLAAAIARLRPESGALPDPAYEPRALAYDGALEAMDTIIAALAADDTRQRDLGIARFDHALVQLRDLPHPDGPSRRR